MSEIDKVKEEISWLKVLFGLLVAIDVSLIGWIAQNFFTTFFVLRSLAIIAAILVTFFIVMVNRRAYRKIDKLGELWW